MDTENCYREAFNELYAKASPDLKKKIDEAKLNPDSNDRDVSDFVKKVITQAELKSEATDKPKPDLG